MEPADCLPAELRPPATTIARIGAGLSGAAVYRVEGSGHSLVLKVAGAREPESRWHFALQVQRLAADAGLTPRIVHVDEQRRAVLTERVDDRSFMAFLRAPATHEAALTLLGQTVRRLHTLPPPAGADVRDPRQFLGHVVNGLLAGFALPAFCRDALARAAAETPPPNDRPPVLGHNDLNPTNLVYDGTSILLVDWATAGPMDPLYDLAVLALFLRLDEPACLRLMAAYDGGPIAALPARFGYHRRLAAALVGGLQLSLARQLGHRGATGHETPADALRLDDLFQKLHGGALQLGTSEGQWIFGLSLLRESLAS